MELATEKTTPHVGPEHIEELRRIRGVLHLLNRSFLRQPQTITTTAYILQTAFELMTLHNPTTAAIVITVTLGPETLFEQTIPPNSTITGLRCVFRSGSLISAQSGYILVSGYRITDESSNG